MTRRQRKDTVAAGENGAAKAAPSPRDPVRLTPRLAAGHLKAAVALALAAAPVATVGHVALTLLVGVLPVAVTWLTKVVLDSLAEGGTGSLLWPALGLATAAGVLSLTPRVIGYLQAESRRRMQLLAQERLFAGLDERLKGLSTLENPWFHDRVRIAGGTGSVAPGQLIAGASGVGQSTATLTGFFATVLYLSPWLAAALAAAAIPTLLVELSVSRRRARVLWRLSSAERRRIFYESLLTDPHSGKEVRLLGLGRLFRTRMGDELRAANAAERALDRRELVLQTSLMLLGAATAGAGLVWAIGRARHGDMSVGDVTVFVAAVAGVQAGLSELIGQLGNVHQSMLEFDHYQVASAVPADLAVPAPAAAVPPLRSGIVLRDVWFRYTDDQPWILRGVDLTIPAGRSLALVGPNGSGKSTIVKLLCRLYDPTRGSITWDGVDLRETDPDQLRNRISAVFQDYLQLELPAAENIGLGDIPHREDRARIVAAARAAQVHDDLSRLPHGYDTMLTRMFVDNADRDDPATGVFLSGGQGQRVAIARGLFRAGRDLLILDEPSSGLDAEAEHTIHSRLREHREGRTSVLISHRLNTTRDADQIAVLREGRISELGDHDALMRAAGSYAELFSLQAAGYAEPVRP